MSRHLWSDPERYQFKTEMVCERCGIIKVRRHEWEGAKPIYWTEFYRPGGLEKIAADKTPECVVVVAVGGAA